MAVLDKSTREFVAERLPMLKKDRLMTIRMDIQNKKTLPKLRRFWIPYNMNQLTLIISNGVDLSYLLSLIKLFKPSIVLNLEMDNFTDEDINAEQFMELLGYYQLNELSLAKC